MSCGTCDQIKKEGPGIRRYKCLLTGSPVHALRKTRLDCPKQEGKR